MPRGDPLWKRLEIAYEPELHEICKIMKIRDFQAKPRAVLVEQLSEEIRSAAGHSILNWFRHEHAFPYKRMLIDVADKIAPGLTPLSWTEYRRNDRHTEIEIEETIWRFFEEKINKRIAALDNEQKRKLAEDTKVELVRRGYSQGLIAQVSGAILGSTAGWYVGAPLAYYLALQTTTGLAHLSVWWFGAATTTVFGVGGAVALLLYAPFVIYWLGQTAYRKTIPTALQLIMIRKLREAEERLK